MRSNLEVIETYWDACWNNREVGRLGEVFHDPYTHGRTPFSPDLMGEIITDTVASFPDFKVQVNEVQELEGAIITRSTFHGTHGGEIFNLAATGKSVEMPTLDIFFFEEGRVRRYWHLTDHLPIIVGIDAEVKVGGSVAVWD